MTDYLVFTLVAPIGSFGDLAGHERRGSDSWPSRSAILGLVGAAQGIRRDDRPRQEGLPSWSMAVSTLSSGRRFRDFHTVQAVPTARIKRPSTRREALRVLRPGDNPVVTRRDYRTDCAFGVAMWGSGDLHELQGALTRPFFVPYLGRKSCPLAAPMAPSVIEAESPVEALRHIRLPPFLESQLDPGRPLSVASDEPLPGGREQVRWDEPLDRTAWHFGPRAVHIARPSESPADR
ncbi:MAG: type I-E CRISPR-associated protein Cas5/CasD [Acidobacteria bacterium]|nr:type I-E CRISPR-associated protein Cas5/CasD [Acidobacteriota bacterium]